MKLSGVSFLLSTRNKLILSLVFVVTIPLRTTLVGYGGRLNFPWITRTQHPLYFDIFIPNFFQGKKRKNVRPGKSRRKQMKK